MNFFLSAVTGAVLSLSLILNPAKLIRGVFKQAKAATNIEAKASLERAETVTTTSDENEELEVKEEGEVHGKAKGQEKISAYNSGSGKVMLKLLPKIAVDHSVSLEADSL